MKKKVNKILKTKAIILVAIKNLCYYFWRNFTKTNSQVLVSFYVYKVFIVYRKKHYLPDHGSEPTVSEGQIFKQLKRIFPSRQVEELQTAAALANDSNNKIL